MDIVRKREETLKGTLFQRGSHTLDRKTTTRSIELQWIIIRSDLFTCYSWMMKEQWRLPIDVSFQIKSELNINQAAVIYKRLINRLLIRAECKMTMKGGVRGTWGCVVAIINIFSKKKTKPMHVFWVCMSTVCPTSSDLNPNQWQKINKLELISEKQLEAYVSSQSLMFRSSITNFQKFPNIPQQWNTTPRILPTCLFCLLAKSVYTSLMEILWGHGTRSKPKCHRTTLEYHKPITTGFILGPSPKWDY